MSPEGKAQSVCKISSKYKEITYSIQDLDNAGDEETEDKPDTGVIRESRLRESTVRSRGEDERKSHQEQLYIKKLAELKDRYEKNQIGPGYNKSKARNLNDV